MKLCSFFVMAFYILTGISYGQSIPNLANESILSPTTQMASQINSVPVNIFTGVPQVGVPIYSYNSSSNGLSFNISLDYIAGGTQVAQAATSAGLGWYLSAGGLITRTVRGAPDDQPVNGYMYAAAIPTDYRSNGDKYYFDSLDTQQDIFQFNISGRTGKFFIGKNGQIVTIPSSKIRIIPTIGTGAYSQKIIGFRMIMEDGTKYIFNSTESTTLTTQGSDPSLFRSAYSGQAYFSSWYLSQIISAFNTDTIRINYNQVSSTTAFAYPQVTFVRNSDGVRTQTFTPLGTNTSVEEKISSVVFPDKTQVSFIYGNYGISKIEISDTIFRYGYLLNYIVQDFNHNYIRYLLQTITPYTSREKKNPYFFVYNLPYFEALGSAYDSIQNERDYWGYYNAAGNGSNVIPKVNGYSWGANRNPDSAHAVTSALHEFIKPEGGTILYDYELNDHLPYIKDPHKVSILPTVASANAILLSQVFNSKHQLTFALDSTVPRTGTVPLSGTGNLLVNIKSSDGTITYATYTLSLYNLFYEGIQSYVINLPNGNYQLQIPAVSGTTITGSFPVNITWQNTLPDSTHTATIAGGLRVKRVTRKTMNDDVGSVTVQEYKYVNADGTSSGFLGDIPKYDYPFQQTVNFNGTHSTSYTAVSSEPVNNMDYAQGSPVGYSRVVIYEGTSTHNIGSTVYDFTSMKDVNSGVFTATFPYAPQDLRDWGIGLPKNISVYDTTGRLLKKETNIYAFDTTLFVNSNFKSIKLGNSFIYCNGDSSLASTPKTRTYIAQEYYPITGRAYIVSSYDTLFQANGSMNTSYLNMTYDSNYNVTKLVSSYDRNRGLQLEKRFYYPYNYSLTGPIKTFKDSSILTPVISEEDWITGDANPRILGGTITDYQQINGYIKPLAAYSLQSNGPVPLSIIGAINGSVLNRNPSYFVKQSNFISYDTKGNLLQAQNAISGVNNCVIMDYGQLYPVAKVSNASYSDIAYTSFESDGTGNWTIPSPARDNTGSVTGKYSYNISNGDITKSGLNSSITYLVSLWAQAGATVTVNGAGMGASLATQGVWSLYNIMVTGVTTVTIHGSGLIDELRLHPKDANMITTTYEPNIGVTSTADANNTISYNQYDNLNRLKLVLDKDKNILKRYDYSDTSMLYNTAPVWVYSKACEDGVSGVWDSTKTDTNPNSDTYNNKIIITSGTNYCTCSTPAYYPTYRLVNGVCEDAPTICYTGNGWNKATGQWTITYHYKWSDNSISQDYTFQSSHSFTLQCTIAP